MSESSASHILDRILAHVRAAKQGGKTPVVVFDLDHTLLDNGPRTVELLLEFARERGDALLESRLLGGPRHQERSQRRPPPPAVQPLQGSRVGPAWPRRLFARLLLRDLPGRASHQPYRWASAEWGPQHGSSTLLSAACISLLSATCIS